MADEFESSDELLRDPPVQFDFSNIWGTTPATSLGEGLFPSDPGTLPAHVNPTPCSVTSGGASSGTVPVGGAVPPGAVGGAPVGGAVPQGAPGGAPVPQGDVGVVGGAPTATSSDPALIAVLQALAQVLLQQLVSRQNASPPLPLPRDFSTAQQGVFGLVVTRYLIILLA